MEFQSMKLLDFLNLFGFPDLFWISPLFFRISSWFFFISSWKLFYHKAWMHKAWRTGRPLTSILLLVGYCNLNKNNANIPRYIYVCCNVLDVFDVILIKMVADALKSWWTKCQFGPPIKYSEQTLWRCFSSCVLSYCILEYNNILKTWCNNI